MHYYSMILVKGPRRCMHKSLKVCLKPGPEAIFRWQDHILGDIRRIGHTSTLVLANNFCPILIGIPHVSVGLHQDMALYSIETPHATVYNGNKCKVTLVASHGLLNLTTPRHSFFLRSFESLYLLHGSFLSFLISFIIWRTGKLPHLLPLTSESQMQSFPICIAETPSCKARKADVSSTNNH